MDKWGYLSAQFSSVVCVCVCVCVCEREREREREREGGGERERESVRRGCLPNVPGTCQCISGADLLN